jgi:prepilin-type N-terminal cleavage/methylation domain-containing protein
MYDRQRGGFTIVELLIVIVVIAILAAVTIVAFNGVKEKAHQATFQSDYESTSKAAAMYYNEQATSGTYPFSATTITQAGIKLSKSSYNAAVWCYNSATTAWALVADNKDGKTYYVSNTQSVMTEFTANKVQGTSGGVTCPVLGLGSWVWLVQCPTCAWTI